MIPGLAVETKDSVVWVNADIGWQKYEPRGSMQSKVAIVGISCRMPGGVTDTEKDSGNSSRLAWNWHRKIPADRFDVESHHDHTGKKLNTSYTAYGCSIDEPGLFDNMSPREAKQPNPMPRLALVTAYEALKRTFREST